MELLIGLVFLGASLAVAFVLPILSFLRSTRALRDADALAREVQVLRAEVAALRAGTTTAAPPSPADIAPEPVSTTAVGPGGPTLPTPAVADDAMAEAAVPPIADSATDSVVNHTADSIPEYAAVVEAEGVDAPAAVAAGRPMDGLEERIGARWLLYAGIGSLILGVSYFIKFAFDNGWVSEPLRVAIGLAAGGALIGAGQRFVQRGLRFFGHTLSGGGLVVLYVAIYAALHAYDLIGPSTAFTAMVAVTLLGLWLADRHRVEVLGALALVGGFVTPALVGGGQDRQIVLFLYGALLLAGALAMVVRYAWAGVAVLAYGCSVLLSIAWAAAHYRADAGLRTLLLITIHLVLLAGMVVALRRRRGASALAVPASWVLLTAPLLYHAAALWLIGRSQGIFLVYLLVATVAGLSVSYHAGWRWARTILLALVAIPFIDWMGSLIAPRWYTAALVAAIALYLLHLAGQWRDLSDDDPALPVPVAEFVHTHVTGVFLPVALYAFLDDHAAWWNAPMLAAVAGWNLGVASVVRARMPILAWQFVALGATTGAVAISEWFDGPVVAIGWALEGVAVGYAALRSGNRWLEGGALALLGLSALRLLEALGASMPVGTWPIVNTRTLATVVVVGAMAWLAARARDIPTLFGGPWARHTLIVVANMLAIAWVSAEIIHVFAERALAASTADLPAGAARAELGQQVALSVAWALYAVGLVAAGFRSGYAPARYLAIALFGLTIVKVMTRDVAELDRVYQMLSVLGVGVLLVSASYLYQRMTRTPDV
ncbi:MAG: DUF2339 domain-containing protein [Acidobacteria bacterium]|nr:DUF2339 domain-containing protein [Acidobacteriota bacterium]